MRGHDDLFYGVKPTDPFKKLDSEIIINDWRKHQPINLSIYSFPIGIPARIKYTRSGKQQFDLDPNSLSFLNGKKTGKAMLLGTLGKRSNIKVTPALIERVMKRLPKQLVGLSRKHLRIPKDSYHKPNPNIQALVIDFVITYGASAARTQPYMGVGKMPDFAEIGDTHDTLEIPCEIKRHPTQIKFKDAILRETYCWFFNLTPIASSGTPIDVDNRVWEPFIHHNAKECKYVVNRKDYDQFNCFHQVRDAVVSTPIKHSIKAYLPAHRLKGRVFKDKLGKNFCLEKPDKKGTRVLLSSASDMGKYGSPNLWYSLSVIRCHKGKDFNNSVRSTRY